MFVIWEEGYYYYDCYVDICVIWYAIVVVYYMGGTLFLERDWEGVQFGRFGSTTIRFNKTTKCCFGRFSFSLCLWFDGVGGILKGWFEGVVTYICIYSVYTCRGRDGGSLETWG